jgi:hypothetical protein
LTAKQFIGNLDELVEWVRKRLGKELIFSTPGSSELVM